MLLNSETFKSQTLSPSPAPSSSALHRRKWKTFKTRPKEKQNLGSKMLLNNHILIVTFWFNKMEPHFVIMITLRSWHLVPSLHGKYMGQQCGQWQTLFWGGPKITADGDCSHEIKRRLLIGRKVMINSDNTLKSRDMTLSTKVYLVKAMVFPVVMYGCESWTIKKAEHQRIDAFELRCWRRLLRVPWTARRSNQTILKEISPEGSLEGLMLKLKLQYFGHLMRRTDSFEKTLLLGKIEGRKRRGRQRMRRLDGITNSMEDRKSVV